MDEKPGKPFRFGLSIAVALALAAHVAANFDENPAQEPEWQVKLLASHIELRARIDFDSTGQVTFSRRPRGGPWRTSSGKLGPEELKRVYELAGRVLEEYRMPAKKEVDGDTFLGLSLSGRGLPYRTFGTDQIKDAKQELPAAYHELLRLLNRHAGWTTRFPAP